MTNAGLATLSRRISRFSVAPLPGNYHIIIIVEVNFRWEDGLSQRQDQTKTLSLRQQ